MSEESRRNISTALSLIDNLQLPHPSSALLSSFVHDALNPEIAAKYVQRQLEDGQSQSLVSDWIHIVNSGEPICQSVFAFDVARSSPVATNGTPPPRPNADIVKVITQRDGYKCCVSGNPGTFWDPLIVVPVLPVPTGWFNNETGISNMLGAFFGQPYLKWWRDYASCPDQTSQYRNHWLVRKSVSEALQRGTVKLVRRPSSMIEYEVGHVLIGNEKPININGMYALLGDYSRLGIETVDARFVGTHARLCRSVQLVNIARRIAPSLVSPGLPISTPSKPQTSRLCRPSRTFSLTHLLSPMLSIWLLFPATIRMAAYKFLRNASGRWYGLDRNNDTVQRLPFGLYLKYHAEAELQRNEFNALRMVQQHATVPAPRALDCVSKQVRNEDDDDRYCSSPSSTGYILMTRLPGTSLSQCYHALSDQDCENISLEMKHYISQIREIPKSVNPQMAICNSLGEACRDHRIRWADPVGPFADEAAFSQELRFSDDPGRRGHKILFTHGDLNPRNILVDEVQLADGSRGWHVSGIVDWETAGYYPEYWECTKAMYEGFRWPRRYNDLMRGVFAEFGDYSRELDVEKRSWGSGDM